jgi:hypothetical protein
VWIDDSKSLTIGILSVKVDGNGNDNILFLIF